jgi:hypothetical protein
MAGKSTIQRENQIRKQHNLKTWNIDPCGLVVLLLLPF